MGMVELSLVNTLDDINELKEMIINHQQYTDSAVAAEILDNWEQWLPKFIKVIPYEYKKILEEQKLEQTKKRIEELEHE
jgi:glutamate synthase (NADPH/NADH) large chain